MYEWCNNATDRCEQVSGRAWCSVYDKAYTCTCNTGLKEETDEQGNFIKCAGISTKLCILSDLPIGRVLTTSLSMQRSGINFRPSQISRGVANGSP